MTLDNIQVPYTDYYGCECVADVLFPKDLVLGLDYLSPLELDEDSFIVNCVVRSMPTKLDISTGIPIGYTASTFTDEKHWKDSKSFISLKARALAILKYFE